MIVKITEENIREQSLYVEKLKKLGVEVTKGFYGMELRIDTDRFRTSVTRKAGRKTIGLKKNGFLVSVTVEDIRKEIAEKGQTKTAEEYGISRRTLMRKIKEAEELESETLI